jgi:hypothetical protein
MKKSPLFSFLFFFKPEHFFHFFFWKMAKIGLKKKERRNCDKKETALKCARVMSEARSRTHFSEPAGSDQN